MLFWFTEYDPAKGLTYFTVVSHAGTFAVALFEGFVVNAIPIRLLRGLVVMFFGVMFVVWTVIQNYYVANPLKSDDEGTEALYNILDWGNSPTKAAIVSALVVFVAMPLFQTIFWGLSLYAYDDTKVLMRMARKKEMSSVPQMCLAAALKKKGRSDHITNSIFYWVGQFVRLLGGGSNIDRQRQPYRRDWTSDTYSDATMNGHLKVIQWARATVCDGDWCTCTFAAMNGHLGGLTVGQSQWVQLEQWYVFPSCHKWPLGGFAIGQWVQLGLLDEYLRCSDSAFEVLWPESVRIC